MKRKPSKLAAALLAVFLLLTLQLPAGAQAGAGAVILDWSRDTFAGVGGKAAGYTAIRRDESPAVDEEGRAYLTPEDGYLYCIAPDGRMQWKVNLNQAGWATEIGGKRPEFDQSGNLYIGSGDGNLYAVSPEGQVLWTFGMQGEISPGTSPALSPDGQTVYAATKNLYLHAVDAAGGGQRWVCRLAGSGTGSTPATAPDGTVYVGAGGFMNAVNPDGTGKWQQYLGDDIKLHSIYTPWGIDQRMAVDAAGGLYLAASRKVQGSYSTKNNALLALDSGGNQKWRLDANQYLSAPAVHGNSLYYQTDDHRLRALDTATGQEKWNYRADELYYSAGSFPYDNEPRVDADGTVVAPIGHSLYAVNPDGTLKWQSESCAYALGGVSRYGPAGELYCIGIDPDSTAKRPLMLKFTDGSYAPQPAALSFEDGNFAMLPGGVCVLQPVMSDGFGRKVKKAALIWESSAPGVVAVDASGTVTAVKAGTAVITVSAQQDAAVSDSATVAVLADAAGLGIKVSPAVAELQAGKVLALSAEITDGQGVAVLGEELEWSSTFPAIAAVNGSGVVSGLQTGRADIKARVKRFPDLTAGAAITVCLQEVRRVGTEDLSAAVNILLNWYRNRGVPGGDWDAFGLNAVGEDVNAGPYVSEGQTYLSRMREEIVAANGNLGSLMTDYERTVLGIISAGADPTDFEGYDLIQKIVEWPGMGQGINAAVFGLIAMDAANAPDPADPGLHNRAGFIDYILSNLSGDGWAYGGGSTPDPDMTGMALYALAPYRERGDVSAAGEKAIAWLSSNQEQDGRFGSWGTVNSESCSQVILGLAAWGVDPQGTDFTKSQGNAVTGLLSFQTDSGAFKHTTLEDPGMATEQALEALAALRQFYSAGVSTIFYKIQYVGAGAQGEITALEVCPDDLVLEQNITIRMRAKNQMGLYVPDSLLAWEVDDAEKAVIQVDAEDRAMLTALSPGECYIYVSLKENAALKDQGRLTVAGKEFDVVRTDRSDASGRILAVSITNLSGEQRSAVFIFSVYRKDTGEQVHLSYVKRDFAPAETAEVEGFYKIPASDLNQYGVRVLVWDKFDRARPLTDLILEE